MLAKREIVTHGLTELIDETCTIVEEVTRVCSVTVCIRLRRKQQIKVCDTVEIVYL